MDDDFGEGEELNAAGETRLGFADAAGDDGLLPFGGQEVKDAVGFAVVGAAKDDGLSAEVRHERPRVMERRRVERQRLGRWRRLEWQVELMRRVGVEAPGQCAGGWRG